MHIIIKIIYGLGMGCFYLYQWLLPEPPSEINYSFAYSGGYPFSISGDIRSVPS